jgi:hypothetical protein
LATIINYYLLKEKVKTSKFLAINNEDLRKSANIGKAYLMTAINELTDCNLINRKAGLKWKEGEEKRASEYRLIVENLKKPIKIPSTDKLLESLFETPLEPLSTKDSPTITNTITNTKTNTITKTESKSDSTSASLSNTKALLNLSVSNNKSIKNSTILSNDSLAYNNPKSDKNLSYKPLNEKTKNATVLSYKTIEEEIREEDFRYNKYKQMLEGITRATAKQVAIENNINF